jgi:hypothetical protein
MAKSSKKTKDAISSPKPVTELKDGVAVPNERMAEPTAASASAPKAAKKRTSATARKTAASPKPRKTTARAKPAPAQVAISDDDIRMRAYFLAERRAGQGLPGDSSSDWLEARRQLLSEAAAGA